MIIGFSATTIFTFATPQKHYQTVTKPTTVLSKFHFKGFIKLFHSDATVPYKNVAEKLQAGKSSL